MNPARATVTALSWLIAVLALAAAAVGVSGRSGDGPFAVVSARGEAVELYGRGLYQYDSLFTAGGAHGTDVVVLVLGGPLLVLATMLRRRRGSRIELLHAGMLLFFLYVYGSASLGTVAFNMMFPAYVAIFSASLFALVVSVASADRSALAGPLPRRGPATFLFVSGAVTLLVWGGPLVTALISGVAPERLDAATTDVTFALDVGIIVPAAVVAGALILRRAPLGYLVAVPLLVLEVLLAPMITAQTVGQVAVGVSFTAAEVVGPIVGFVALALAATWFLSSILRGVTGPSEPASARSDRDDLTDSDNVRPA